jgi:peptidoglycan-associated lipoprotein
MCVAVFQGCSKDKDVSTAADGMNTESANTGSDGMAIDEENLDSANAGTNMTMEEAQTYIQNLPTIYFGFDQYSLTDNDREALKMVAEAVKTVNKELTIQGHTDERGSSEYNLALGNRRAMAVSDYLNMLGVRQGNLDLVSYGEERPAAMGSDESAWAKNRRAELMIR